MKIKTVKDIVSWRLCIGCGACANICANGAVTLHNLESHGIRPYHDADKCRECGDCVNVCSGYTNKQYVSERKSEPIPELAQHWGPILEMWEGYAGDKNVRFEGSSGGVATALALYCLEHENADGVLHTSFDEKKPWLNETVFSTTAQEVMRATGSRYAPASPCEKLKVIEQSDSGVVFIGKGCDNSALRNTQDLRPEMEKKVTCAIGIFCAGTPSTRGTLQLLDNLDVDTAEIKELRYRGRGWPGMFATRAGKASEFKQHMTYADSWGFIQRYRPFRCYLCPDGTAETADISCGDAWYRDAKEESGGYSLVLVRTEKGRKILQGAIQKGYVTLTRAENSLLPRSQANLQGKQCSLGGRLAVLKCCGVPVPRFSGWSLTKNWLQIGMKPKLQSILSTIKRVLLRKLYRQDTTVWENKTTPGTKEVATAGIAD